MKICPTCGRSFDIGDVYCPEDGATLSGSPRSAFETPTQVIQTSSVGERSAADYKGPLTHVLVGGMGATILALLVAVYFLSGRGNAPENSQAATGSPAKALNAEKPSGDSPAQKSEPVRSITESDGREILGRWIRAQNSKDYAAYAALYHSSFVGFKVTPDGESDRQAYNEWLRDRKRMLPNFITVNVSNERISIEGETVVVRFTQQWRSVRHCDIGEKEMTIQMHNGSPKIRSEILRNPYPCVES